MSGNPNSEETVWRRLVESHLAFVTAGKEFMSEGVDRVRLLRKALLGPDRITAIHVASYLRQDELAELFRELVFLASVSHGLAGAIRKLLMSLPREFVLREIEEVAEPLLREGDYDVYRRLLELYSELDAGLVRRLATRAAQNPDEDIREAGLDFLGEPEAGG